MAKYVHEHSMQLHEGSKRLNEVSKRLEEAESRATTHMHGSVKILDENLVLTRRLHVMQDVVIKSNQQVEAALAIMQAACGSDDEILEEEKHSRKYGASWEKAVHGGVSQFLVESSELAEGSQ